MIRLYGLLMSLLLVPAALGARDGGEIGNAFVPFESLLGRYAIEYPKHWKIFDLGSTTSFSDPAAPSPDQASFFSVLADRFPGIRTMAELNQHLKFFHPEEEWKEVQAAGLNGFQNSRTPRILYLFRGKEDLLSIRYRSSGGALHDGLLETMLRSLKVE